MERRGFLKAIGLASAWPALVVHTSGQRSHPPEVQPNAVLSLVGHDGSVVKQWPLACDVEEVDGCAVFRHDPISLEHHGPPLGLSRLELSESVPGAGPVTPPRQVWLFADGFELFDGESVTVEWPDSVLVLQ